MTPKIRNIIIFVGIAAALVLIYIFIIKPPADQGSLVSTPSSSTLPGINDTGANANAAAPTSTVAQDFLTLLLSVNNIKLDDTIFSDPAFGSLHESVVDLSPDGNEGRPNPFAQFGSDAVSTTTTATAIPTTTAPATIPATSTKTTVPTTPTTSATSKTPVTP